MKLFIHVGLPKTGTTFLQQEVFPKIENVNFAMFPDYRTTLYPNKINIIGDEFLSHVSYMPGRDANQRFEIAKRLQGSYPDAKIIIGIRDQKSWLRSLYNQYVRAGGIHEYDYWFENMFNKDFLDTESYINFLKKSFKKGVYVYRFEDMKKNYSVWIKDLCDFIGCDVPKIERKKHNVGWGKNRIKIALFFNKFFKSPVNPEKGFFTWREWHSPRKILDTLWLLAPKKKSSKKNKPRENI